MKRIILPVVLLLLLSIPDPARCQKDKRQMWQGTAAAMKKQLGLSNDQEAQLIVAGNERIRMIDSLGQYKGLPVEERKKTMALIWQQFNDRVSTIFTAGQLEVYRKMQTAERERFAGKQKSKGHSVKFLN